MQVEKSHGKGNAPTAFMQEVDVQFISLVDKGANKQRFAIYKASDDEGSGENKEEVSMKVKKDCAGDVMSQPLSPYGAGSSFKGALAAMEAHENLVKSRNLLEEYFFLLKMVLKGVLDDESVKDKSAGIKKAIEEFKQSTVVLFDEMPIEKASEMLTDSKGGESMKVQKDSASASTPTADGAGTSAAAQNSGGVAVAKAADNASANGPQDGKNRPSGQDPAVEGIGKKAKKAGLAKEDVELLLAGKKSSMAQMTEQQDDAKKKKKEILAKEVAELEEVLKAWGDGSAEAPASGRDQVSSNAPDGTTAQAHPSAAAAEATGVNKSKVTKDALGEIGATNPEVIPAVTAKVGGVDESDGGISKQFESFKKLIEVGLDGALGPVKELLKQQADAIAELKKKVDQTEGTVASVTKMAGLSNADIHDWDNAHETRRGEVQKTEEHEWSGAIDAFGGLRGQRAASKQ